MRVYGGNLIRSEEYSSIYKNLVKISLINPLRVIFREIVQVSSQITLTILIIFNSPTGYCTDN